MKEKVDLQHKLAEGIAELLDESAENREEHILLVYGIELFLNEFLKILLILLVAALLGEVKLAAFFTSYLIIARRCSGGNIARVILVVQ